MLKRWKKHSSRTVYQNPWWTYQLDEFEIPGGVSGEYHYVHTHGSSMVIPQTDEGDLLMVKQYRYLCDRESLEFPGGGVLEGRSHLEVAHAELSEETGYAAQTMEAIGAFNPYNGVTNEICQVFLAKGLHPTTAQADHTEEFELLHIHPNEFDSLIQNQSIWDGMTLAAWSFLRSHVR